MKKFLYILLFAFLAGIFLSACQSSSSCSAYGEAKHFQKGPRN